MSLIQTLEKEVENLPTGQIFTYKDISINEGKSSTLIKGLSKLYNAGILKRLGKGMYFKPLETRFGSFVPDSRAIVSQLLSIQKKNIAYLSGLQAFNALGFTRQLSKNYLIMTDKPRSPIVLENAVVYFAKSRITTPTAFIEGLQILDALQNMKSIPDISPEEFSLILIGYLKTYSPDTLDTLVELALSYPPSTRAFLGLFLEQMGKKSWAHTLCQSLNPTSSYRIPFKIPDFIPSMNWNIQ